MSTVEYNLLDSQAACTDSGRGNSQPVQPKAETGKRESVRRVTTKELCVLARQLGTLLRAGMPLMPALSALAEQQRSMADLAWHRPTLAPILAEVTESVNAGSTLAEALAGQQDAFPPLFANMVAAGEASGTLEQVLFRLAEILEKRLDLAGKVKSAIAYPVMMIVVATGVVAFLLSFVAPNITQIFLELNRELPWPTRMLIASSNFLKSYLVMILIALFGCGIGIVTAYKNNKGRFQIDRMKLRMPVFGKLLLRLEIVRVTGTLGVLLTSGIPILTAIEIAKRVIQNAFVQSKLDNVGDCVGRGDSVADAIRKTSLFPPIAFHIVATSQAGGDMETGFLNIAEMYEGEIETSTRTMTALLEPAILLIMGVVVGFIVLAIMLPIFEISRVI
jgi:general secretion pathway protein F